MKMTMKTKLAKVLDDPKRFNPLLAKLLFSSEPIMEGHYKREAPVFKGDLRKFIDTDRKNSAGQLWYRVGTRATSGGYKYPFAVHEGTGRFAGLNVDFPSTGRIRAGTTDPEAGGIKPNKFATRAKRKGEPQVHNFLNNGIKVIINKF